MGKSTYSEIMEHRIKTVIIGAGNVATHLAQSFSSHMDIVQIYSYSCANAKNLATTISCQNYTDKLSDICPDADLYIISIKDDAIESTVTGLNISNENAVIAHTSGSKPITVFNNKFINFGVLYPLQTFSKDVVLDISKVPFFVEGNNSFCQDFLIKSANLISEKVYEADSEKRKCMHIAAVFACNFANYLWSVADEILSKKDIPFDVLMPLIQASIDKLYSVPPHEAQTGPAVRGDIGIINEHLNMLSGNDKQIYDMLSKCIMKK